MTKNKDKENKNEAAVVGEISPLKQASLKGAGKEDFSAALLAHKIAALLDEKKAKDITLVDISKKTIIADYFVIASAKSTTQVRALTEYVDEKLSKDLEIEPLRRDMDTKWCAIDYGPVIMHVFYEETREFYQLERLWSDGDNVSRIGSED